MLSVHSLSKKARRLKKTAGKLWGHLREDFTRYVLPKLGTLSPLEINALANDICNSRCQMCLIWQQKKAKELTPEEWRTLLSDPFFASVRSIGFTGGEPTLRQDLPELFRAAASSIPGLKGISMITNAIREKDVIQRVRECSAVCAEHGLHFSVMVSLDGVESVHDTVRGREGNFKTATACLREFISLGYPTTFGCTVTKSNAAHVDELLDLAQENGWSGRFRIAEFIDRLYNAPQSEFIRNFTAKEKYHLSLFYHRLISEFERNPTFLKTYRNILGMISAESKRSIGCPYHNRALVISSTGSLLYCAPKSPQLGSPLEEKRSARDIFTSQLQKRRDIRSNHCDSCIHDYHVPPTTREFLAEMMEERRRRRTYGLPALLGRSRRIPDATVSPTPDGIVSRILIVGWFGTETVGDKAILWSIVKDLRRNHPGAELCVSSLFPFVTRWTIQEMGLEGLKVLETYSREFEEECLRTDVVVFGGGPIMDIQPIDHALYAFAEARRRNRHTLIYGCGYGPITGTAYAGAVSELIRIANEIRVRDEASLSRCTALGRTDATRTSDPAGDYLRHWKESHPEAFRPRTDAGENKIVACFFRDITPEYNPCESNEAFFKKQLEARKTLLGVVLHHLRQPGTEVHLHAMHSFSVGGDDRKLARWIRREVSSAHPELSDRLTVPILPESPEDILNAMTRSDLNLCMRFHSVVFAELLETRYSAIDYTHGGKIHGFLKDRGKLSAYIDFQSLMSGKSPAESIPSSRDNGAARII